MDLQRTAEERLRLGETALVVVKRCQVVEGQRYVKMVAALNILPDFEDTAEELFRLGVAPLLPPREIKMAEFAEDFRGFQAVRPVDLLSGLSDPSEQHLCLGV